PRHPALVKFDGAIAQHDMREIDIEFVRRDVRALRHEAHVAERAGVGDLLIIGDCDAIELARIGIVYKIEQARERVAQIEAAAAAVADVEDAPHLRLGLGPVEEVRVFPGDDVTGWSVEAAFAHNSPLRAGYAGVLQKRCVAIMWGAKAVASAPPRLFETSPGSVQTVERPLEPAGMRFLGLGEGLEPVGDLVEAFIAVGSRTALIRV